MTGRSYHSDEGAETKRDRTGRRDQLRSMLRSAADAARDARRATLAAARAARPLGQAVRDRVSLLLIAG